jgi:hypothetical protein
MFVKQPLPQFPEVVAAGLQYAIMKPIPYFLRLTPARRCGTGTTIVNPEAVLYIGFSLSIVRNGLFHEKQPL